MKSFLKIVLQEKSWTFARPAMCRLTEYSPVITMMPASRSRTFSRTWMRPVSAPAAAPAPAPAPTAVPVLATGTAGECKLFNVGDREAAMLMAIVADKMGKPLNTLRFKSMKEVL